eukprot:scaffold298_cov868-Pavlova_lutheri.AAC.1
MSTPGGMDGYIDSIFGKSVHYCQHCVVTQNCKGQVLHHVQHHCVEWVRVKPHLRTEWYVSQPVTWFLKLTGRTASDEVLDVRSNPSPGEMSLGVCERTG